MNLWIEMHVYFEWTSSELIVLVILISSYEIVTKQKTSCALKMF
jgi:hypothetical protein